MPFRISHFENKYWSNKNLIGGDLLDISGDLQAQVLLWGRIML
jgi:hypothetical protein